MRCITPVIFSGLQATATKNLTDFTLEIYHVDSIITDGRFGVDMNFIGDISPEISGGSPMRMRIEIGKPSTEILVPVGSFYKDTGGNWIFVVDNNNLVTRRKIKLGRKKGSEYYEVLNGLTPGEQVITSSYENFNDIDSTDIGDLVQLSQI